MPERDSELPGAETLAYTMSEAVTDQEGDAAQEYLVCFMDEILHLEPGLRSYFSDRLIGELKEQIVEREDPKHSRAVVALVESIEAEWQREA